MATTPNQPIPHFAHIIPTDGSLGAWLLPAKVEEGLLQLPQAY